MTDISDPVIEVRNVSVRTEEKDILRDVSITVRDGDFYAIIGPNGGGKTTLLHVILGLVTPSGGSVKVLGRKPELARNLLGYVPQYRTFDFNYPISVREMVLSGRLGHIPGLVKRYRPRDFQAADAAMNQMGIAHLKDRTIRDLSGGERQRAIIARALSGGPRVLILDEPTIYVDSPTESRFYEILDDLKQHITVLLVTHDIGVISGHVTKVACLNQQLFTHDDDEITEDMITSAYRCPVDLIAHGLPHRVLKNHGKTDPQKGGDRE